jgi:hypothetical protein
MTVDATAMHILQNSLSSSMALASEEKEPRQLGLDRPYRQGQKTHQRPRRGLMGSARIRGPYLGVVAVTREACVETG